MPTTRLRRKEILSKVITDDESWAYSYDAGDKAAVVPVEQFSVTDTQKDQTTEKQCQEMVIVFCDIKGTVCQEPVTPRADCEFQVLM